MFPYAKVAYWTLMQRDNCYFPRILQTNLCIFGYFLHFNYLAKIVKIILGVRKEEFQGEGKQIRLNALAIQMSPESRSA